MQLTLTDKPLGFVPGSIKQEGDRIVVQLNPDDSATTKEAGEITLADVPSLAIAGPADSFAPIMM